MAASRSDSRAARLAPGDPRWRAYLSRVRHDVYHLPGYVQTDAEQQRGTPVAFLTEADGHALLVPLILRTLPAHLQAPAAWRDAVSPYGYPAPLVTPGCRPATAARLVAAFRRAAADAKIVSVFLRLHPLLPLPDAARAALGSVTAEGPTVVVDVQDSMRLRRDHRRAVRRLERDGFTVAVDRWELLPRFVAIYTATMTRVGADPFYQFGHAYFRSLHDRLSEHLHLATVHAPDGRVAAAGLFTAVGEIVQFHLSGTAEPFVREAPSKLLVAAILRWSRAAGHRSVHLGGGIGAREDSLFLFKAGFSDRRATFRTARLILKERAYAALAPSGPASGFFPAYRAPVSAS